jgi:hypothetical protein
MSNCILQYIVANKKIDELIINSNGIIHIKYIYTIPIFS